MNDAAESHDSMAEKATYPLQHPVASFRGDGEMDAQHLSE